MKYIDEYRDKNLTEPLAVKIIESVAGHYTFMEVCGGHTSAIHRFGIRDMLPENIRLISGPGCPVCVTETEFIDRAIALSMIDGVILTTFGDLVRVPGSGSSLEKAKAAGADVRIVFSALEALDIARKYQGRRVIFMGIGFETTAPGTAVTVFSAGKQGISNFMILSAHKVMPPAMEALIKDGIRIDGFICPGHVATITGSAAFDFIPGKYKTGCVIAGFEPADILQSVLMLVTQVNKRKAEMEIQYRRAVTPEGNILAQRYIDKVFEPRDVAWRGLGSIALSGLALRREFETFDAEKMIPVKTKPVVNNSLCICGEILRGLRNPPECPLFSNVCTPANPSGACMVSNEGACNVYYRYRGNG